MNPMSDVPVTVAWTLALVLTIVDRAVAFLGSVNRHPYVVLGTSEVAAFKARFEAENRVGRLDWAPPGSLPVRWWCTTRSSRVRVRRLR